MIFFTTTVIHFVRRVSFSYITFERGNFVIENLLNKKSVLRSDLFDRLFRSNFSLPFENALWIHFKNGERYKIIGGLKRWDEVEAQIESLIKKKED